MSIDPNISGALPDDVVAEFPLSPAQRQHWLQHKLRTGDTSVNVCVRWEISGPVSPPVFESAFRIVIARHELLRSRFEEVEGEPRQIVLEEVSFKLDVVDLRALKKTEQEERFLEIAQEIASLPFDLSRPPLLRATLVQYSPTQAMLTFVVHHLCFDAYSVRVIGSEIGEILKSSATGTAPNLSPLPLQYGDYCLWKAESQIVDRDKEARQFFKKMLGDMPFFELPTDSGRAPIRSPTAVQAGLKLPDRFSSQINLKAGQLGMSPFSLGAAVFAACLQRASGLSDVSFDTPVLGRDGDELYALIGVFINNIVLRFQGSDSDRFVDYARRAGRVVQDTLAHSDYPFDELIETLNPPRDPSRPPMTSARFTLRQEFMESGSFGEFDVKAVRSHAPGITYDLGIAIVERPDGWFMDAEYSSALYRSETVEALMEMLCSALEQVLNDEDQELRLGDFVVPSQLLERDQETRRLFSNIENVLYANSLVDEVCLTRIQDGILVHVTPGKTGTLPLEDLPDKLLKDLRDRFSTVPIVGVSALKSLPRTPTGGVDRARLPQKTAPVEIETAKSSQSDAVRDRLSEMWGAILGLLSVPTRVSFFDLGGHSILVMRLLAAIRDEWGVTLDIMRVYQHPTVEALALLIASSREMGRSEAYDWRVFRAQTEGSLQPLLGINYAGTATEVARRGHDLRPTTILRVFDGQDSTWYEDFNTFEDLACAYVEVVRQAQSKGPYLFYGNCVHGNMALEIARILQAEGETIAGVVMSDVWEPNYFSTFDNQPGLKWREKVFALQSRLKQVREGEINWANFLNFYGVFVRLHLAEIGVALGLIEPAYSNPLEQKQEMFVSHMSKLRNAYKPALIDFPVLHVVSDITPRFRGFSHSIGWENVVEPSKLRTVYIPRVRASGESKLGLDELAAAISDFLGER